MPGPGGGPSRRSHTKSRKGCKTCKKRHIRCDETFPQCRNCTKHQVRCDYMDSPAATGEEIARSPRQANLLWTPEIERSVDVWRQTGEFPFPELQRYPQPQWKNYNRTDLRLIHHLSSIANEMLRARTSKLTLWSENMPQFLSLAATFPFVMHSLLAFSASHIAWISQSNETRNLAFQHGGIALKGLTEAIGNFSRSNSDAVLASSMLLSWQATDWRGWASLMSGTKRVIGQMQPWRMESAFAGYLAEHGTDFSQHFADGAPYQVTPTQRQEQLSILRHVLSSLQRLQPYIASYENESKYFEQLIGYVERLRASSPPHTAIEQFSQLYALRKWLFWVPISLLASRKGDVLVMMALAYFYATALALEPLFPNIGASFCADIALNPLEEVIRIIQSLQSSSTYNHVNYSASILLEFPRETAANYRHRREWLWQQRPDELRVSTEQPNPYGLETFNLDLANQIAQYSYAPSLSPAFAPSPLQIVPPSMMAGQQSPYLEVPQSAVEPLYSASTTSSFSSPLSATTSRSSIPSAHPLSAHSAPSALPSHHHDETSAFNFGLPSSGLPSYSGGFVATPVVWT